MMRNIYEMLKYDKKDTLLHRLDPRSKLIVSILYLIFVVLVNNIVGLLVILIPILFHLYLGKVLKKLVKSLITLIPFLAIVFIINYLAYYDVYDSITPLLRFLIFLASMDIFFFTTDPDDFSLTLEKLHLPLTISLSFMLALRFIPTMTQQVTEIIEAQLSRGLKLDKGSFFVRLRNYIPILTPLIILSIKRSIEVAESLEVRGVYPGVKKTSYITLNLTRKDFFFILVNTIIVIFLYIVSNFYL